MAGPGKTGPVQNKLTNHQQNAMKTVTTFPLFGRLLVAAACSAVLATPAFAERNYLAWAYRHDPASSVSQNGVAVTTDRRGNVAVAGYTFSGNREVFYIAKYDSLSGGLVWKKTLASLFGNGRPTSIATDSEGNVIVTGYTEGLGTGADYITVKYLAADGDEDWSKFYNNPNNSADKAVKVVVDKNDDVIVTGSSVGAGTQQDFHTIKYDGENGDQLWEIPYNSPGNYPDKPADLFVDADGNVAVTGVSRVGSNNCYYTAKYDGAAGTKIWGKTYDSLSGTDDEGKGVVIDDDGEVTATGYVKIGNTYSFHTIKYSADGNTIRWEKRYDHPEEYAYGPAAIGIDPAGNVVVSGSSKTDNFKATFYTVKYDKMTGAEKWFKRSAGEDNNDDIVTGMAVDAEGNVIVTGSSKDADQTEAYYTIKYEGEQGDLLWEQRLNGLVESGSDVPAAVAVDRGGNVVVTGTAKKPGNATNEMLTVKYNRFLLTVGDPIQGDDLTEEAVIASLNTPAVADTGAIAARVGIKDGSKRLAAIVGQTAAGGNSVLALQGKQPAGGWEGEYKSFQDPVIAPNGTCAFIGKMSGLPASQSTGVWTTTFNGNLQLALQTGRQVPGLPMGVTLKSVSSISIVNGYLAALITASGPGYTGAKANVFLGMTNPSTGYELLRVGEPITIDGSTSNVKKFTVYAPTKTSPGHGRYHGGFTPKGVILASLEDKRNVVVSSNNLGTPAAALGTNGKAAGVGMNNVWKAFGLPAVASNGFNFCTLATLKKGEGDTDSSNDTVIMTSVTGALNTFGPLIREGANSGVGDSIFTGFSDPISASSSRYAFLGTLKGTDINGSNRTGLFLASSGNLDLIARTGDFVPDAFGDLTETKFSAVTNFAFPNTSPIFLAKVKGAGVNGKNNLGLWGRDSGNNLRQILRNGDQLGEFTVKKFTMLNSVAGAYSVSRTFNNAGGVTALVNFTDRTQALVYVGIP